VPGVYLSYPFCAQKCTYCNFASGVYPREIEPRYVEALLAEIREHRWQWTPETIYWGGGTPSQMNGADFRRVMDALPGRPWREATIEAAPGTVTEDSARLWRQCGIDRVSLGVQSFVPREAARTGRKHTPPVVEREVALLRAAGIEHINVDLIAGLAGQTHASWSESLDWVERLAPDHVSVYILEIDEDSRLGHEVLFNGKRFGAPEVPGDEITATLYESAVERLRALGRERYEISNFARPGCESRHNLKYWLLEPYAGFGADAHSFDEGERRQNVETVEEYLARFAAGQAPCASREHADSAGERFYVGLRLMSGIRPTVEERLRFAAPIERFVEAGLLTHDQDRLRLTDRGVLLSNEVFQEFVP
jgi:oxygen-independent coproporphyrinogen-3 oxidase